MSFVTTPIYAERYSLKNGMRIVEGDTYNVISPCWLYSSDDKDDVETITILYKGIVEKNSQ